MVCCQKGKEQGHLVGQHLIGLLREIHATARRSKITLSILESSSRHYNQACKQRAIIIIIHNTGTLCLVKYVAVCFWEAEDKSFAGHTVGIQP